MKIVRVKIKRLSPKRQKKDNTIACAKLFLSDGSQVKNILICRNKKDNVSVKFPQKTKCKDIFAFRIDELSDADRSIVTNLIVQATWQMIKYQDIRKLDLISKDLFEKSSHHLEDLYITYYRCFANERRDITAIIEEFFVDTEELDDLQYRLSIEGYSKKEIDSIIEYVVKLGGVQRANKLFDEVLTSLQ